MRNIKINGLFSLNRRAKRDKDQAQGMVEFALVLPILLLLIFGIIEFGRLLFMFAAVTSASREGARYGAAVGFEGGQPRYRDCAGIEGAALRIGGIVGVTAGDIVIEYDHGANPIVATCPPSVQIALADRIIVTVTRHFQPLVPLVNIPGFPISARTARTIIKNVQIVGTPGPTITLDPGGGGPYGHTPTPTATDTPTPSDTPTPTPSDTPTPTDVNSPTPTPTASNTSTASPTATPTPSNTPTASSTPTPTPVPPCAAGKYQIVVPMTSDLYPPKAFYAVYFRIKNISLGTLRITGVTFDWPPPIPGVQGSELPLNEIRFHEFTSWNRTCGISSTCLWNGWSSPLNESFTHLEVCESGCTESFRSGVTDRELISGEEKDLTFVFGDELKSSINTAYDPNPFPYRVRVVFDNSCYVETLQTQYYHP